MITCSEDLCNTYSACEVIEVGSWLFVYLEGYSEGNTIPSPCSWVVFDFP